MKTKRSGLHGSVGQCREKNGPSGTVSKPITEAAHTSPCTRQPPAAGRRRARKGPPAASHPPVCSFLSLCRTVAPLGTVVQYRRVNQSNLLTPSVFNFVVSVGRSGAKARRLQTEESVQAMQCLGSPSKLGESVSQIIQIMPRGSLNRQSRQHRRH